MQHLMHPNFFLTTRTPLTNLTDTAHQACTLCAQKVPTTSPAYTHTPSSNSSHAKNNTHQARQVAAMGTQQPAGPANPTAVSRVLDSVECLEGILSHLPVVTVAALAAAISTQDNDCQVWDVVKQYGHLRRANFTEDPNIDDIDASEKPVINPLFYCLMAIDGYKITFEQWNERQQFLQIKAIREYSDQEPGSKYNPDLTSSIDTMRLTSKPCGVRLTTTVEYEPGRTCYANMGTYLEAVEEDRSVARALLEIWGAALEVVEW